MKKFILISSFIFLFGLSASAQKVEVDQAFVDDATKAFREVVALRSVVDILEKENESRKNLNALNDQIITRQKEQIAEYDKLVVILQKKTARSFSVFFGLIKLKY